MPSRAAPKRRVSRSGSVRRGPGSGWYHTSDSGEAPGAGASMAMASSTVGGGATSLGGGISDAVTSGAVPTSLPPNKITASPQVPTPSAPFHDMRDHTDGSFGSAAVSSP